MIERVVLVKLSDEHAHPAGREAIAAEARRVFPTLPGVVGFHAGVPADAAAESSWDLSLVVRFERIEDVAVYLPDPGHRAFVDTWLNPRSECKKAWNFEIS